MSYDPTPKTRIVLKKAMEHIQSVPYKVSLRWLSYRLLQDGTYKSKEEFSKLKHITILARKNFFEEWKPDTLADDTRQVFYRGGDFKDPEEWIDDLKEKECSLDVWYNQNYYVELWFEAQAMKNQFEHYTKFATLVPFKGDLSVAAKWNRAKELELLYTLYRKPIKILYFGDCDPKGLSIPRCAIKDIKKWCEVNFDFEVCGLTPEQAKKYSLPENFEKPGSFQWEALPDEAAAEIITTALNPHINKDALAETKEIETRATYLLKAQLEGLEIGGLNEA